MDKKLREATNLCEEIMNSKRQVKEKLGHVVKNSLLPFDVNVKLLNLSIIQIRDLIKLTTSLTLGNKIVRVFKLSSRALDERLLQSSYPLHFLVC